MLKILLKISGIILGNLLAFFIVWLILDAFFDTDWRLVLASIVISLPVFGLIMYMKAGKILWQLHNITSTHDRNN